MKRTKTTESFDGRVRRTRTEAIVGAGAKTGVFLTDSDFKQLIEVIARAKAKDKMLTNEAGVAIFGGSQGGLAQANLGDISIQRFVRQLAEAYNLPLANGEFYGVNKHREFIKWVELKDIAAKADEAPIINKKEN